LSKKTLAFNFNLTTNLYDRKSFNYACIWREAEDYNLPTSTSPSVKYLKEALTNYNPAVPFTTFIYGLDGIYDLFSVNKSNDPLVFGLSGIASFFVSLRRFRRLCQENPTWKTNIFSKFDQFLKGIELGAYSVYQPVEYHDIKQQYDFTVYTFQQNPSFANTYQSFKTIINTLKQNFLKAYINEEFNNELCNCQDIENFETSLNYESNSQFKGIMDQRRYVISTVCGRICNPSQFSKQQPAQPQPAQPQPAQPQPVQQQRAQPQRAQPQPTQQPSQTGYQNTPKREGRAYSRRESTKRYRRAE